MKNVSLLVWVTQLGLSVALPLGGFVLLGVWLRQQFNWGTWVVVTGVVVGVVSAFGGLRNSLKTMEQMAKEKTEDDPPVSFNEHE